ncbi:MAG: ABC transporter permease [Bacteroidetes bacterium]|nr:ABC transporter permease [Bacteroidota bacterium]
MSSAPVVQPVAALWKREILKFVRDRSRLVGALAQPLGFWLLLGLGFQGTFRMPQAEAAGIGYMEFLFPGIVALILLFTAVFTTISVVEERQRGFLQAALVAPAPRWALVLGNTLGGTTLAVLQALLFLLLLPLVGLPLSLTRVALVLLVSVTTALAFTALGFIIAWRMETTRGFHAVMNLLLLPMWLLSGAAFPAEGASVILRWIMRLNPVSYAVSALRQAIYWPDPPTAFAPFGLCLAISAAFALALLGVAAWTVRRPLYG